LSPAALHAARLRASSTRVGAVGTLQHRGRAVGRCIGRAPRNAGEAVTALRRAVAALAEKAPRGPQRPARTEIQRGAAARIFCAIAA
jgi:hypothetical protein